VPARLERTVEVLERGERPRQVLEDLEAEDRVVEAGQRRIVVGLHRHHGHEAIPPELPAREVEEQVRDVGPHELQVEVAVAAGQRGEDRGRPAAVLGHPPSPGYVVDERVNA